MPQQDPAPQQAGGRRVILPAQPEQKQPQKPEGEQLPPHRGGPRG